MNVLNRSLSLILTLGTNLIATNARIILTHASSNGAKHIHNYQPSYKGALWGKLAKGINSRVEKDKNGAPPKRVK